MPGLYGYEVDEERAIATILSVFDSEINFLDTSNDYGQAERGSAPRSAPGTACPTGSWWPPRWIPLPGDDDFSGKRVLASTAESLDRLGLDQFPLLYLHDPERIGFEDATAAGGPFETLIALKREGLAQNIGIASGDVELTMRFLATDTIDVVLNHNRFTLIDQSALPLIEEAALRQVAFVNAAPYGGGMLSKGPQQQPIYSYRPGPPTIARRAQAMQEACTRHGVPLAAAALQFSLRNESIASTVVGVSRPKGFNRPLSWRAGRYPTSCGMSCARSSSRNAEYRTEA
ncbi:MAG: aldo/keto reductase [Galbitalea sp.]